MAGDATCHQELFASWEMSSTFRRVRGIRPGPGGEFIYEVVARKDEFFWRYLASRAESGGMRDGGPAVSQGVESRVYQIHNLVVIHRCSIVKVDVLKEEIKMVSSSRASANRCLIGWPADSMVTHNGPSDKCNCYLTLQRASLGEQSYDISSSSIYLVFLHV